NGHFESTCYHPLLLFNREGDCLAAKLRPGNVHMATELPKFIEKLADQVEARKPEASARPLNVVGDSVRKAANG
ncbi:MAG: hypothetical protein FJW30_29980, partial [Acidobacteria bacterium]|nr:hypothetical protein [Acidobacteriota bacterium]